MTSHGSVRVANAAGAGNLTAFEWRGGKAMFVATGTWGGGSLKLQTQVVSTWVDVANSTLSADGTLTVDLAPGQYRGVIATASAVTAYLTHIPT